MKRYTFFLIIFISSLTLTSAQNKVSLNIGYGNYLSNSENGTKIMNGKNFRSYFFFGFIYQRENLLGLNLQFDYNYHKIIKENIISFVKTSEAGPEPIGIINSDLSLISHNFDFSYIIIDFENYFSIGGGPSFVINNRIYEVPDDPMEGVTIKTGLYDKLASSGLGINGFVEFNYPVSDTEEYFFISSKLKFRYTHSIWFDKGIRKLDDYLQEFLTFQFSVGVGYHF